jgi:hypothetical protein
MSGVEHACIGGAAHRSLTLFSYPAEPGNSQVTQPGKPGNQKVARGIF